jgi:hypothetical protein
MSRRIVMKCVAFVLMTVGSLAGLRADIAPEYRAKAAFIYKFATYIRWPPDPAAVSRPFVIGILGDDPFGPALPEVLRNQAVHGRAVRIRELNEVEDALECDVVFISASERAHLPRIFAVLRDAPVLTVGDMDQFAERGGVIGLTTTEDRHIRFDINKAALDQSGLRASSQLLQLARIVRTDEGRR